MSVPLPVDADDVVAHLKDTMLPEIQNMIQQQILLQQTANIKTIIDTAINEAVTKINETLMKEINAVKEENTKLKSENAELSKSVVDLTQRVDELELVAEDSEQYSRRNSIRITGISENKDENTDDIVLKLASDLGVYLNPADIDRSHSWSASCRSYANRSGQVRNLEKDATAFMLNVDLRDNEDWKTTFINEDLTTCRSKILFKAWNYVRTGLLKSSYSSDGRIYVQDKSDEKHLIVTDSDLKAFGTLPETSSGTGADGANASSSSSAWGR